MLKGKIKKRFLIFLVILILVSVTFITDNFVYRIISAGLMVIYIGFIIFLRDSVKEDAAPDVSIPPVRENTAEFEGNTSFNTDENEGFEIISKPEKIEVLTSDAISPKFTPRKHAAFKPSDFKENYEKIAFEKLPDNVSHDEQFTFALNKILTVAKEAFLAHSALFFWYNKSKKRLTLEEFVSVSQDITERKFIIENDVLSKIVQNEDPELLTDIPSIAETDTIRYYIRPQGIKSFVGVPLFYGESLAGILALDSKERDLFGIETIYSLGRIVRVISIIIALFDDKFKESQAEQRLKSLLSILSFDKKFKTQNELFTTLEQAVRGLIHWDAFTFVYFNPIEQKFKTSKIVNNTTLKYVGENLEVNLRGTLVGKSVLTGTPVKIDDTSANSIPRFSLSENVSFDGSFLAIPLVYDGENYGVLCFESLKKKIYSFDDVKFLKNATKIFAYILYAYSNNAMLENLLSYDIETRLLNKKSFMERFESDLIKAAEFNVPGAIALIKIDDFVEQESLFDGDPFPKVLTTISDIIKKEVKPLNLIGRISKNIFAIYFFNNTTKNIFIWSDRLRQTIARTPITVAANQSTFTVSIGIASTTGRKDMTELLKNADLALNKALEKGGNNVKSIN